MSLPAFSERARAISELPSLGLLTLAGLTPPDWTVCYSEIDEISELVYTDLANTPFQLVAISALTARILDAYALADYLRAAGKTVVLGGLHISALPKEAAHHANTIVIGEAESVWPQLLNDYLAGHLQPIYQSPAQFDFANAPLPRYDLLDPARYNRLSIQTTRGCPLDCEFCGASRLISRYQRKPINLIQRDLEAILDIWPRPYIELADDNTFIHREWSMQLADLFARYNFHWFTETDISIADDHHLLEKLAVSGCAQLLIGFESVSSRALRGTDSRGWKANRLERYISDIQRIQSHGIAVNGCFAFGFDEDTVSVFEDTRDFIIASGLTKSQVTILTPFPGTALRQRLANAGRLLTDANWTSYTLFDVTYRPARMSAEELCSGIEWIVSELYSDKKARLNQIERNAIYRRAIAGRVEHQS